MIGRLGAGANDVNRTIIGSSLIQPEWFLFISLTQ